MRRPVHLLLVLALILFVAPLGRAEEEAKRKTGMSPEQVARIILLGGEGQQVFAAQYLQRANAQTLLAVQRALRGLAPRVAAALKARGATTPPTVPAKGPVTLVDIQTRVLQVTGAKDFLRDLAGVETRAGQVMLLDDLEQEVILRAVEKSERVQQITAPRITVYDGQRANVSITNQISYIQDYDVEVKGENWMADPIVGVVQDGLIVDLRPVVSKDRETVTVDIDFTWADVKRPIQERKVILREGGAPVTIPLPEIDVGSANATATLPAGGAALIAAPVKLGNGKDAFTRYVMVTTKIMTLEAQDLRKKGPAPLPKKRPGK